MKPGDKMYKPDERISILANWPQNMSAYKYAEVCGVHHTTLSRWANGSQKTQRERWNERMANRMAEYRSLRAEGLTRHKACLAMGLNHITARRWDGE
jgi:hypothetical protein